MDAEFEELPKEEYFPVEMNVEAIPSVPLAQLNESYIVHHHGSDLRSPEHYTVTEGIGVATTNSNGTVTNRSLHNYNFATDITYEGSFGGTVRYYEGGVRGMITHDEFSSLQGRPIRYVSEDNTSSTVSISTEQECYEIDWSKVNTVEDIVTIMIALQTSFRIYKKSGEQPDIKYRDLFSRDLMKKV